MPHIRPPMSAKDKDGRDLILYKQPYTREPLRSATLFVRSKEPFNGEPPLPLLVKSYVTPTPAFFVRNHSAVPQIDLDSYVLEVRLGNALTPKKSLRLSLAELRGHGRFHFPSHTMTCTLQCAGNRRTEMNAVNKVKGLPWGAGAIGNATWTGVWLRDVLSVLMTDRIPSSGEMIDSQYLGLASTLIDDLHVEFEGWDGVKEHNFEAQGYAASIPLSKCVSLEMLRWRFGSNACHNTIREHGNEVTAGVMLAWAMNGEPLTADHGAPLRVVVPGYIGARSVKWLRRVTLFERVGVESSNFFQQRDYKLFPPSVSWDNITPSLWDAAVPIQEMNVNCVICAVNCVKSSLTTPNNTLIKRKDSEQTEVFDVDVVGYAISGGGRPIERVDISSDGGITWNIVEEVTSKGGFSWSLWRAKYVAVLNEGEIVARAWDAASNSQPESMSSCWNLRGVLGNAYSRYIISLNPKQALSIPHSSL